MKYEIVKTPFGEVIKRINDNQTESFIPKDLGNSDYQRYLNPEAEQSTPIVEVTQ